MKSSTPAYAFVHAVYRQVCCDRQGVLRRIRGHREIGTFLERSLDIEDAAESAADLLRHFKAAIAACDAAVEQATRIEAGTLLPAEQRLCCLLRGLAESRLGNHEAALQLFTRAEAGMDNQPAMT